MPGPHHPERVRRLAVQLALAQVVGQEDNAVIAAELELAFGRRVPEGNIKRWISDEEKNGFSESIRQRGAAVRKEHAELETARVVHTRIPRSVRSAVYTAVLGRHDLYARELADHVHHVTGKRERGCSACDAHLSSFSSHLGRCAGMWFSEDAIGRVRHGLGFHRRRVGRPLGQADPVEQRMYKNLWAQHNIRDEQVIFIDETSKNTKEFYRPCGYFLPGSHDADKQPSRHNIGPDRAYSTLGVFTVDGMIDWNTTPIGRGGVRGMDTMAFLTDVNTCVLPWIQPYPAARSIVICDNVAIHHAWRGMLQAMVEARGGRLLFLPT